jgi:phosphoribosylformylglycinamidine synthase
MVWHRETSFPRARPDRVPGGFSYGDYLRSGAMAANSPIMRAVKDAAERGVPCSGICNGFPDPDRGGLLPAR